MAHAIVFTHVGPPEVLRLVEIPDPTAGPGEVVVQLTAVGVNPRDVKVRSGVRPLPPSDEPHRLGLDAAGIITAVGEGVTGFAVGDRVAVRDTFGSYASALAVGVRDVALLPAGVSDALGASLGIPAGTAYQVLRSLNVQPDDVLLVHAGSGAVGQALIQFAVAEGVTVVATASLARHERLRTLGAIPVTYGEGLEQRLRDAAPAPFTVAVDAAGTDEAIAASLALVADRERIATIVRGPDAADFGIRAFSGGSPHPLTDEEEQLRADALPRALALIADGRFSVELGPELPLADAAEAHRLVEANTPGKIILRP
ncbi:quinone oxidoreductase family protein [Microbacterium keratanolyticum]